MTSRTVFFVSDRTGITVETLGRALLAQFEGVDFRPVNLPFVDDISDAEEAAVLINRAAETDRAPPIVFSTLVDRKLRGILQGCDCVFLGFFEHYLGRLSETLGVKPLEAGGRSHLSDTSEYLQRIEAINYTLDHDDGVSAENLGKADIILTGVSRSGKTPTCLYLSMQFGIHAANFPLTEDDLELPQLPASVKPYKEKLFGLKIDPRRIRNIREQRRPNSRYASLAQCQYEIRQAERLFKKSHIPYIDSTSKSIEEIATTILQQTGLTRRFY
ncbi:MAG: kinase/pyrophosphorylase [Gammaproteobacteria bacterium]|nr:kinase/pyrophosphorylase [Gammaproteobacteria bacterium]